MSWVEGMDENWQLLSTLNSRMVDDEILEYGQPNSLEFL